MEERESALHQCCEAIESELAAAREHSFILDKAHEAIGQELAAVRSSMIWRITAPMRTAARRFRRSG
jgi:hypothetical protein